MFSSQKKTNLYEFSAREAMSVIVIKVNSFLHVHKMLTFMYETACVVNKLSIRNKMNKFSFFLMSC